ncbi:hypothetical protein POSPLADRAFT_1055496 [Postia placenta MAD-698-R-SB12]|uniref:Uncharacterized protein n=1 Tax=Postia placenta MAD-698-R-SB12 TaxID=670580 RepID=A0A1X6N4M6_9APHY|nr:hypothetical protein POSPLADRAFT_1055496 [Postia placenta MAD-698-R-SB12]OSX63436.1 hypothetical protein POSPLADRAFT_1055496 [Postia placenta MAD-698-R-SB12]
MQPVRYCRKVSVTGEGEIKDLEAASVDEHKPSASGSARGLDVYAPLNSILREETSDCWPAATELDLSVRLDSHLSFSPIADTFRSAYECPRAPSIAGSCLVCTLFDALNSGDNEARIATAKAMLTGDVWDDLEADICADTESVFSMDSPSVWLSNAPSVYSTGSTKTGVPYHGLLLSLPPPSHLRVPHVVVKAVEPEPVFSSGVSASYYGSVNDFGAVGLTF